MNKPNIRFQDGQWLDADRLNKAMEAVDAAVDATNAAEASAAGANTSAAASAQSANTARSDADNAARDLATIKSYVDGNQTVGEQGANIALLQLRADKTEKHLGMYSKNVSKALTGNVATNRILTTLPSGEVTQVEKQGWNISRIDIDGVEVTSGDTVFLPLRSAQGENLLIKGVVPFARLIEQKDSEGQVVRQTIKSLYGASNTDICEWGGIKKELALRTGEALLICHPAVITEVVIGRNAEDASSAAAQLRQEDALDEKANLSGFHGAMITGGAISLVPEKADDAMPAYTENLPAARMVGDAGALTDQTWAQGVYPHYPHVPDDAKGKRSSLSIERVEGEVLGVNHAFSIKERTVFNGVTITAIEHGYHIEGPASGTGLIQAFNFAGIKTGYKFLGFSVVRNNSGTKDGYPTMYGPNWVAATGITMQLRTATVDFSTIGVYVTPGEQYNADVSTCLLDLTLLFPTPSGQAFVAKLTNTQSSALAVCNKLGYASVITYDE